MRIPDFDEHELLPVGVHDCTLAEVTASFGLFQGNEQRPRMDEPSPHDIDLILVLPSTHDRAADLPPLHYNLRSRKRVRSRFGFDMVAVRQGTTEYAASIEFFQQVRGEPGLRKGILRLTP